MVLGMWIAWQEWTHILVSFDEAPPAIFWTRSWPSSVLRSSSCLVSSSLFLPQRVEDLTRAVDDCNGLLAREWSREKALEQSYHGDYGCDSRCRSEMGCCRKRMSVNLAQVRSVLPNRFRENCAGLASKSWRANERVEKRGWLR